MWLGSGYSEGRRSKRRDLSTLRGAGRSESPHSPVVAMSHAKRGEQNRVEGRWVGRRMGKVQSKAQTAPTSAARLDERRSRKRPAGRRQKPGFEQSPWCRRRERRQDSRAVHCQVLFAHVRPLVSYDVTCSETLPMRKLPTGEPYARKPHVRFGGRCAVQVR